MEESLDLAAARSETPPEISAKSFLKREVRGVRRHINVTVMLGLLNGAFLIAQAWVLSLIIAGSVQGETTEAGLISLLGVLLGLYGARAVLLWLQSVTGFWAARAVKTALRRAAWERLVSLGPAWTQTRSSGALSTILVEQVEAVEGYVARYMPQMTLSALVPVVLLVAIFPLHWGVGLVLALTAPLLPVAMIIVGKGAARVNRELFRDLARMGGHFQDRLSGLTSLVLFNRAEVEVERVQTMADAYRRATMRVLRMAFLSSTVLELFAAFAIAATALLVGFGLLGLLPGWLPQPQIGLTTGLFVLFLAPEVYQPLRQLSVYYHDRAQAVAAAEALLTLETEAVPRPDGTEVRKVTGPASLRFEDVSFIHRSGVQALERISFHVKPEEKIAVTGASGAGKSTLLTLLQAFQAPSTGRILIDGDQDLSNLRRDEWLSHVAAVGQRPHLFPGSLLDNLIAADPTASPDRIAEAVSAVGLDGLVATLPDGLHSEIGDRGFGLSGGQIQRIALARAWLKPSSLLLLDEPTAGLDEATAEDVIRSLGRVAAGRTVIVSTHHPALVDWADREIRLGSHKASQADLGAPAASLRMGAD